MNNQQTLEELVAQTTQGFQNQFGRTARWIAAAPGRVNLIGEHVDYNDGYVLPMAIERHVVIAADKPLPKAPHQIVRVFSQLMDEQQEFTLEGLLSGSSDNWTSNNLLSPQRLSKWAQYIRGTITTMANSGIRVAGFDAVVGSNVPLGGGLSSSAALEVATATLMEGISGQQLEPIAKALACQLAEHEAIGVPCGMMDQFSSTLCQADHLMLLDCRSQKIEMIPLTDPEITVLIIDSNVKHELTGSEYAQRRKQCEEAAKLMGVVSLRDVTMEQLEHSKSKLGASLYPRIRHVINEIQRTRLAADAIQRSAWDEVGQQMIASHVSLRDDYQVSCKELDTLVDLTLELGPTQGVLGTRMTGGGFGGCTVSLVRTHQVDQIAATLASRYQSKVGIEATPFTTRPARGTHMIKGD